MIEKILSHYRESSYDFRKYAHPEDPLAYLFDRWVPYYKMKHSICSAIAPSSILEVGVRYGYSCMTFLDACPEATYLGIDADRDSFGGVRGAIEWARYLTKEKDLAASFLVDDTQTMTGFPGDRYDLIHIDGQQDGDGTFHDLEMAIRKGRFILIDGFYWSRENMLSSILFTDKYKSLFEYALIIPGYAGDLLIKISDISSSILSKSNLFEHVQNENMGDLGEYNSFLKMRFTKDPSQLDGDSRNIFHLIHPLKHQKILDIGCGRGELAFSLSFRGADVTGVDYSQEAVSLARNTFTGAPTEGSLTFLHGDFNSITFENAPFDTIVAADVVEHLDPDVFPLFLQRVQSLLFDDGMFFIHTAPNKLHYQSVYARKQRHASQAGLYLPPNPRTLYEDLMHINEQTPASLRRSLKKVFPHVCVWVAHENGAGKGLVEKQSWREIREGTSIFAVASNSPIDRVALANRVRQQRIDSDDLHFSIEPLEELRTLQAGSTTRLKILLKNRSAQSVGSFLPNPVSVAYHWKNEDGDMLVFDGMRNPILPKLLPGEERHVELTVQAPPHHGRCVLELTLVQELCFWFEDMRPDVLRKLRVEIC